MNFGWKIVLLARRWGLGVPRTGTEGVVDPHIVQGVAPAIFFRPKMENEKVFFMDEDFYLENADFFRFSLILFEKILFFLWKFLENWRKVMNFDGKSRFLSKMKKFGAFWMVLEGSVRYLGGVGWVYMYIFGVYMVFVGYVGDFRGNCV